MFSDMFTLFSTIVFLVLYSVWTTKDWTNQFCKLTFLVMFIWGFVINMKHYQII